MEQILAEMETNSQVFSGARAKIREITEEFLSEKAVIEWISRDALFDLFEHKYKPIIDEFLAPYRNEAEKGFRHAFKRVRQESVSL